MSLPYDRSKIPVAKELRKNATRQEQQLWYDFLRTFRPRFQRQKTISGFVADFYCAKARLVVELDGGQHETEEGMACDAERTAVLGRFGVTVLRFSNREVDRDFPAVCRKIAAAVSSLTEGMDHTAP